ncbi:MAG: hypothetical protein IJR26_10600 [Bacteroidales bacterium]|nr:hypothetical protein [Bacteroidales bacterium]
MNIIDLAYCVFYRHYEKYETGAPAPTAVALLIALYILSIFIVLWDFRVIPIPHLEAWHFFVALMLMSLLVVLRYWPKKAREKRLRQYEDYKKAHPKLYLWRFWIFVSLPVVMLVTSFLIANAH